MWGLVPTNFRQTKDLCTVPNMTLKVTYIPKNYPELEIILNLKFKFPANNSKVLLLKKGIALSEKKPPLLHSRVALFNEDQNRCMAFGCAVLSLVMKANVERRGYCKSYLSFSSQWSCLNQKGN